MLLLLLSPLWPLMRFHRRSTTVLALLAASACGGDQTGQTTIAPSSVTVPYFTYSTKSDEARRHVQAGERLDDTGYPFKANDEFKRAVAADSSFGYAYLRVAELGQTVDEYSTNLQRAVARLGSANPVERLLIQSEARLEDNDTQGSLAFLRQVTQLDSMNPRAWATLGVHEYGSNRRDDAIRSLERALALDSTYAGPMFALDEIYLFAEPKDVAKAEHYALAGQKLWPREPTSFRHVGQLRRAQGRPEEAIAAYTQQIALDPAEALPYQLRGNTNTFAGHYDAARADYDAAIRLGKPAEKVNTALSRAFVDAYAGDVDASLKAQSELVQAIDGLHVPSPRQDKANVRYAQAIIAIIRGRLAIADTAVQDYEVSQMTEARMANSPGAVRFFQAQVDFFKGALAAARGDLKAAQAHADDIERVRKADNGPDKDRQLLGLRGFIALMGKNYAAADSLLKAADPANSFMHFTYWRALAMEGLGKTAEEKVLLQTIAAYNFTSPENPAVHHDAITKLAALK